ncbi:MAG: hypothetical protein RR645_02700, partial [Clostridium sp.]
MYDFLPFSIFGFGILTIYEIIRTIINKQKYEKLVSRPIYTCGYERILNSGSVMILLISFSYSYIQEVRAYNPLGLESLFRSLDYSKQIFLITVLVLCIIIFIHSIIRMISKVNIYEEGIVFTNRYLVKWGEIKKIEYRVSLVERYYIVSVFGEKKRLEKLKIKRNELDKFLE